MKKLKNNKYVIAAIVAIVLLVCGITYASAVIYKNAKDNNAIKDGVKFLSINNDGSKIIEKFVVTLNGKNKELEINFNYNTEKDNEGEYQEIVGKFNDSTVYSKASHSNTVGNINSDYNVDYLKANFNESNFQIIKGSDNQSYLLLITNNSQGGMFAPVSDNIYVLNDNFNLIGNFIMRDASVGWELANAASPWYNDSFNACGKQNICQILTKIEDNSIYYLIRVASGSTYGNIEERVYSINADKLNYNTIKTYKIANVAYGQYEDEYYDPSIGSSTINNDNNLNTYLEYIPINYVDDNNNLIFSKDNITIDDISPETLIGRALALKQDSEKDISKNVIDELVLKMYNKNVKDVILDKPIMDGSLYYELRNNNYVVTDYSGLSTTFMYYIEKSETTNQELIIYTRIAQLDYIGDGSFSISNPNSLNSIKDFAEDEENLASEYLADNKNKFSLYKHTYKKTSDGYAWEKTEKQN